jgi:hypothetical protein
MPKVSIIIATHNRPHLLPRAVNSARESGTDVEIVVVDDASSDHTAQVCQSLPGIKYVRVERNQGVAGARNVGLINSDAEYVSFLDDDDTRLPNTLDRQVELLGSNRTAGLIYGRAILGDADGRPTNRSYPAECPQGDLFWKLLPRNFIPCGSAVFRRSCLCRVGVLNRRIPGIDDWDLWVRIAQRYPVIALEKPVMVWRQSTPGSRQGTSQAAQMVSVSVRQFRKWMRLPRTLDASPQTRRIAWHRFSENMTEHLIWEAARAVGCGRVDRAVWNLLALPRLHPLSIARIAKHRVFRVPQTRRLESWAWRMPNSSAIAGRVKYRH